MKPDDGETVLQDGHGDDFRDANVGNLFVATTLQVPSSNAKDFLILSREIEWTLGRAVRLFDVGQVEIDDGGGKRTRR